jgi:hypothetical protein
MSDEHRPESTITGKLIAKSNGQLKIRFDKRSGGVKPAIIADVVDDAGRDLSKRLIPRIQNGSRHPLTGSDFAINHAQPLRNSRADSHQGVVQIRDRVTQKIHAGQGRGSDKTVNGRLYAGRSLTKIPLDP